jgi:four helix bundle protein
VTPEELKDRITNWAVDVVDFCRRVRDQPGARDLADQLSSSATSTAANYRAACRARSRREFLAKLSIALEEADESVGWIVILVRARFSQKQSVAPVLREGQQIVAILAASRRTASANLQLESARGRGAGRPG